MNVLSIISVLLFLLYLQLGILVFFRNRKSRINQSFLLLSLCFSIWSFSYIFVYSAESAASVSFWDSAASLGYCLFPAPMVFFYLKICDTSKNYFLHRLIFLILLTIGLFLVLSIITGSWKALDIVQGPHFWHFIPEPGDIYYTLFYFYLGLAAFITFYVLIKWKSKIHERSDIKQFNLLFYPLLLFFLLGVFFDLLLPAMNVSGIPNMGHITSLPWIIAMAVSILKFQLLSNENHIMAEMVIKEINKIVIFLDRHYKIVKFNKFAENLLGTKNFDLKNRSIFYFTDNRTMIKSYLLKSADKQQIGPVSLNLVNAKGEHIESSLYFIALRDRFEDFMGYIIYGHDNREAQNLQKEIFIRQHAEKNLLSISEILETRVKERTEELADSYKVLQVKMTERMRVEEQIKADIAEKEVLINEIHNRVKSNMNIIISLINAQDKKNASPVVSQKFNELAQRVKSLLLVHQNLYLSINYSDVDFATFIKTISEDLLDFYKRRDKVELRLEVSDVFLDVDYAIPLGIIMNELIGNALQHGFSNYYLKKNQDKKHILYVTYAYQRGYYEIDVSDNGKGLPSNFNISDLLTNGLPLVEILVNDQINGKLEVFSSEEGSMFRITFLASK